MLTEIPIKALVYMLLLSKVYAEDGSLISSYDEQDIFKLVPSDEEAVESALEELYEEELTSYEEGDARIYVGYVTDDGHKKLFTGVKMSSIQDEFEPLLQAAKEYEQSVESKVSKSKARTLLKKVQEYAELPPSGLRVPVLVDFFGLCYNVFMQEEYRPFQQKEYGQMKSLVKLYDNVTVVRIIIRFFDKLDKFTNTPSIGNMLYVKDKVYATFNSKQKTSKSKTYAEGSL